MERYKDDIAQALQTAKEKGYLEGNSINCQLALLISELYEALNAHRHNRHSNCPDSALLHLQRNNIDYYHQKVASSFEDELADCFIRAFTILGNQGYQVSSGWADLTPSSIDVSGKFQDIVWTITCYLTSEISPSRICLRLIRELQRYCDYHNIPIKKFIRIKQLYNKTREFKNGALY